MTAAEVKRAEAKAASLRFKLNTPPKAAVDVTGIYTDRSYNRKHGGRPESDGPIRRNKKNDKGEDHRNQGDARGRIPWKDEEQKKRNMALYHAAPERPASLSDLPNLTGEWMCSATAGDWDEFLYLLEVDEFTRKLAKARKWGVRHSEQRIVLSPDKTKVSIQSHQQKLQYTTNPTSADSSVANAPAPASEKGANGSDNLADVMMLINGEPQQIVYEGNTGTGNLNWEGKVLVTRMELPKLGPCVIKRSLGSDMMSMTVDLHVSYIHASRTFMLRTELIY